MDYSHLKTAIQAHLGPATEKAKTLRTLTPFILDNSLRESTVGQIRGHTLSNKWAIFEQVKKCNFSNIVVASFSHAPRVDDEFVRQLCEREHDLTPYYAFSELGEGPGQSEMPVGLTKIQSFGLQNVIFEIDLAPPAYSSHQTHNLLHTRIAYTLKHISPSAKILVNIRDFPFAMQSNPDRVFSLIHFLASNSEFRPTGIIYEEPTGRFSLDALAAWTAAIRALMTELSWDGLLLVHVHEKWGYAAATQLECLTAGANGIWASVCAEGAALGHASSTVTLMNLVRLGNKHVLEQFECTYLRKAAQEVTRLTTGKEPHPKQVVYGERALDQSFDFGGIAGGQIGKGDFDIAKFFGVAPPKRMSTLASARMVRERLFNLFGENEAFTEEMGERMKRLMVEDLVQDKKDEYMSAMGLALLFGRAGGMLTVEMSDVVEQFELKSKAHKMLVQEVREEWDEWDSCEEDNQDDCLEFYSFYNAFMAPYFGCYECDEARRALQAIDMDADGRVDWKEFELYLKWALAQKPGICTSDDLVSYAFTQGIIPDMRDVLLKGE